LHPAAASAPGQATNNPEPANLLPQMPGRKLRIVHVDDEPCLLELVAVICSKRFPNLELVQFQNSVTAFQFLRKFDPDLLITDDVMPVVRGCDLVAMLAERKAPFPIIAVACWNETEEWVARFVRRGLRLSCLHSPFAVSEFYGHVSRHLGPLDAPNQTLP
jgi:CheY-like chemotaxis protein